MPAPDLDRLFRGALRYRPTAVVSASRLTEALSWRTERGSELHAEAGDWLLVGDDGDEWTVEADTFARTYRRRPDGRFAKHEHVEAVRLTEPEQVATLEGEAVADVGDWLLRDGVGAVWPVPDRVFRERYRAVDTEP